MEDQLAEPFLRRDEDPFAYPASLEKALVHRRASLIGLWRSQDQRCPCCDQVCSKTDLSVCFREKDLTVFGPGLPLYFWLTKMVGLVLLAGCLLSGGFSTIFETLSCKSNCLRLYGVPILNFQNVEEQAVRLEWVTIATGIILLGLTLVLRPRLLTTVEEFSQAHYSAKHYSLLLQNLPPSTSEQDVEDWFRAAFGLEVVQVVLCYDLSAHSRLVQYKEAQLKELAQLRVERVELEPEEAAAREKSLVLRIEELSARIKEVEEAEPRSLGSAFVTLEEQEQVSRLLDQYGYSLWKTVKQVSLGWFFPTYSRLNGYAVYMSQAPAPKDVLWENLELKFKRGLAVLLGSIVLVAGLLYVQFRLEVSLLAKAYAAKSRFGEEQRVERMVLSGLISLGFSLAVSLFNCVIRLVLVLFSRVQEFVSHSSAENTYLNLYLLFGFVNSAYAIYQVHTQDYHADESQLLLDVAALCLVSFFSDPLYKLLDPLFHWHWLRRRLASLRPHRYPQFELNAIHEGYPVSLGDNYQYVGRCCLLVVWFSPALPILLLPALLALTLNYLLDRVWLAKFNRTPPAYNDLMPRSLLWWLYFLPVVYILGALQYRDRVDDSDNILQTVFNLLQYSLTTAAMLFVLAGYWIYGGDSIQCPARPRFGQSKILFRSDYKSQNRAFKVFRRLRYVL